jgi:hypothetical protein
MILPYDVKASHNNAALKANKLLLELAAQSCKVPGQIRTLKTNEGYQYVNAIVNLMKRSRSIESIRLWT